MLMFIFMTLLSLSLSLSLSLALPEKEREREREVITIWLAREFDPGHAGARSTGGAKWTLPREADNLLFTSTSLLLWLWLWFWLWLLLLLLLLLCDIIKREELSERQGRNQFD